jgi:hypothetical protein
MVAKLADSSFARRAKATDFLTRAWAALRTPPPDRVLDAASAVFAALATSADPDELARQDGIGNTMCGLLGSLARGRDPLAMGEAALRRAGLGRPERLNVRSFPHPSSSAP